MKNIKVLAAINTNFKTFRKRICLQRALSRRRCWLWETSASHYRKTKTHIKPHMFSEKRRYKIVKSYIWITYTAIGGILRKTISSRMWL